MKVYNHKDAFVHLKHLFNNPNKEDIFIAVFDETAVHYGTDGGLDIEKIIEKNIPIYNIQRKGGAIVTSPGDVVYCFITKTDNLYFNMELRNFLVKKLTQKGIPVEQTKNDLLVDGKKCFGFMHRDLGSRKFYGGHISINCNLELIKDICTKPMEKIPTGLSNYGVSTDNIIDWLNEFWFYLK